MYSVTKNVLPAKNHVYRFLDVDEVLRAEDLVRSTKYLESYGDAVNHNELKNLNWSKVEDRLPAWIGKTLNDLINFSRPDALWLRRYYEQLEVLRLVI